MVTVAILGILALVGPTLLTGLQNFIMMTGARNDTQRDARGCLGTINRFLRQAQASSVVIDSPAGQGPYSHVTFVLLDGRVMQFQQKGGQLLQTVTTAAGKTSTVVLTSNLEYIAFTYPRTDDPSIISVAITMGKSVGLGRTKVLELTIQKVRIMNT